MRAHLDEVVFGGAGALLGAPLRCCCRRLFGAQDCCCCRRWRLHHCFCESTHGLYVRFNDAASS